ncbi:metalloregulator ArsR/SmtB family transcription factor [Candidatus Nanopelagicales bacterium]|nr:metalloregulator ArsR/SmtB family transcription factor [Candidatus Nanopelagicales bacterium]
MVEAAVVDLGPTCSPTSGADCLPAGLQAPLNRADAEELSRLLKAVADPTRLQLLSLVLAGERVCACDLNEPLGLRQPTVSHHLKILTQAGLLIREQEGTWAWYSVDTDRLSELGGLFTSEVPTGRSLPMA